MRSIFTRLFTTLGLAAVLLWATATSGRAQGKIENLGLSPTDKSADVIDGDAIFEVGIEEVYVHFDYIVPSRREIEVTITAPGGLLVFEETNTYSGSGSASVEVTGVGLFRTIAEQTLGLAKAAEEGADLLKKQTVGHDVYLQQVENASNSMRASSEILETWSLGSAAEAALSDLIDALDRLDDLVAEDVDFGDDDERKAYGNDLLAAAGDARKAARALEDAGDDIDALPIAATDADRETGYLAQVSIQDNLADSVEFWVTDDALPEPTSTEAPAPTKKPLPTSDGTAVRSATTAAGDGEEAGASSPGADEADLSADDKQATSTARAANVAVLRETEAAKPSEAPADETADAAAASGAAPVIDPMAEGTPEDPNAPTPVATFTLVPGSSAASSGASEDPAEGSGPNIAVLGLGIMALAGIALWLRRRS